MCLNCGCGEPDERHKDTDITMEDVRQAASGSDMPLDQTVQNITSSLEEGDSAQGSAR